MYVLNTLCAGLGQLHFENCLRVIDITYLVLDLLLLLAFVNMHMCDSNTLGWYKA